MLLLHQYLGNLNRPARQVQKALLLWLRLDALFPMKAVVAQRTAPLDRTTPSSSASNLSSLSPTSPS
jgi:hypothetical protein